MSESEEMYLITIARLVEQGAEDPVSISRLASELAIQPVSANQMVHKLAEEGFVEYFPYKGAALTAEGHTAARQVLRGRRLWEVFLVDHLELSPGEADALACRLEHITPKAFTCRLAKFLNYPRFSPGGLPIPDIDGDYSIDPPIPLTDLNLGSIGEVVRLEGSSDITRLFLENEGIKPGTQITILAISSTGGILLNSGGNQIHLTDSVAGCILVIPTAAS